MVKQCYQTSQFWKMTKINGKCQNSDILSNFQTLCYVQKAQNHQLLGVKSATTENGFLNATIFSIKMNMRACRIQWGGWGLLNFLSILNLCIFRIKEAKNLDKKVSRLLSGKWKFNNFSMQLRRLATILLKHKHITPTLKVFWCESHSKALWMKITKKSHWERSELH